MKRIKLDVRRAENPKKEQRYALVDDEDYEYLKQFNWTSKVCFRKNMDDVIYAERHYKDNEGRRKVIMMHREIMQATKGMIIDHANYDGLDNRKHNLRACTPAENVRNMRPMRNQTSKYKGVSWNKKTNLWRVKISDTNGKPLWLGQNFTNEIEAAKIYDAAAFLIYKEYAYLNFGKPTQIYLDKVNDIIYKIRNKKCISSYKGVTKDKERSNWRAKITYKRNIYELGTYKSEKDAAKMYDAAVYLLLGKEGKFNFGIPDNKYLNRAKNIIENGLSDKTGSSIYHHVYWHKKDKKWVASMRYNDKRIHIGNFSTEKEAALAYNKKAIELLGDKARLNIIE